VTASPDEAREALGRRYYPVELGLLDRADRFTLDLTTVRLGALTLGSVRCGSDISLVCDELDAAYHVDVTLSGAVRSRQGGTEVVSTPGSGVIFSPTTRAEVGHWTAGSTQLCLKIDRWALETELREQLGLPAVRAVRFDFGMSLTTPALRGWLSAVRILAQELDQPGGLAAQPVLAADIQHLIIMGLLTGHRHDYSDALLDPGPPAPSRAVKLVMELIEEQPGYPWTVPQLARAAGVSVRALETGFRHSVGSSPRSYLRARRLDAAHQELAAVGAGEATVTAVAHRWGFGHLGRFAAQYRRRFGVSPSVTLRREPTDVDNR
jgi:AraC-like DNA-binding protein